MTLATLATLAWLACNTWAAEPAAAGDAIALAKTGGVIVLYEMQPVTISGFYVLTAGGAKSGPPAKPLASLVLNSDSSDLEGVLDGVDNGLAAKKLTSAIVSWHSNGLEVVFDCVDDGIAAEQEGRDNSKLSQDDSVSVWLDIGHTHDPENNMVMVQVSAGGVVYDTRNGDVKGDVEGLESEVSRTGAGWRARLRLPWKGLGTACPKPGDVWGLNLSRMDRPDKFAPPITEQSSWMLMPSGRLEDVRQWGHIVFAGANGKLDATAFDTARKQIEAGHLALRRRAAKQVLQMTGRRAKIVWTRGNRERGIVMCLDTKEGEERVVVPNPSVCANPWITHDGSRIVFTAVGDEKAGYVVDWDGKNLKKALTGGCYFILGTAWDATNKCDWIYAASDDHKLVYRYKLDDLSVRELMWDKGELARTRIAEDGMHMSGEFPWPNCGVATFPNGSWTLFSTGCNANMAPDGSGRLFHLMGDHRTLKMFERIGASPTEIRVNTMPGNVDPHRATWAPRWSNDVRFFTINSADLGPDADICLGEFDETFSRVKGWVRITDTSEYDSLSFAWIEPEQ